MADETRARVRPELLGQYDSWRSMGMTELQALECLRGSNSSDRVTATDRFEELAEGVASIAGTSVDAARTENARRMGLSEARAADAFNGVTPANPLGLSESELRRRATAAAGNDGTVSLTESGLDRVTEGVLNELTRKYERQGKPFAEALKLAEAELASTPRRLALSEATGRALKRMSR